MNDAFESIERGLKEALAHAQGEGPAEIHKIDVTVPDVKGIRASTGLSQADFAKSIGIDHATLLDWELGRQRPVGNARVLLAMIAGDPQLAHRALGDDPDE